MHLILTGATGLVGSAVLDAMIKSPDVTRISILSRRPVKMVDDGNDPRIHIILHRDFGQYDETVIRQLEGASGCVWALGVSQTQVSKEEYIRITMDYPLEACRAFKSLATDEQPFKFIYVSGQGATLKPGPFSATYARVKGETELILSAFRKEHPNFHTATVRPGFVDRSTHDAIKPYAPPVGVAKGALMSALVKTTARKSCSPTQPLGQFLTEMALGQWDDQLHGEGVQRLGYFPVIENAAVRRLKGLDAKK